MWREQAIIEWSWHVNSNVACCHSAKLCAHAAQDFRSQQYKIVSEPVCDVTASYKMLCCCQRVSGFSTALGQVVFCRQLFLFYFDESTLCKKGFCWPYINSSKPCLFIINLFFFSETTRWLPLEDWQYISKVRMFPRATKFQCPGHFRPRGPQVAHPCFRCNAKLSGSFRFTCLSTTLDTNTCYRAHQ